MLPIYNTIILIDDDRVQNHLNKIVITRHLRPQAAEIISFTDPKSGFEYIRKRSCPDAKPALLLLDINMPEFSGWDFLCQLSQLPEAALKSFTIYMLSSSIDPADKIKAVKNPLVNGCITKPLSDHLEEIFSETAQR